MTEKNEKDEELFNGFLEEYLAEVKKQLPGDDRAKGIKGTTISEQSIKYIEGNILREPFFKALEKDRKPDNKMLF